MQRSISRPILAVVTALTLVAGACSRGGQDQSSAAGSPVPSPGAAVVVAGTPGPDEGAGVGVVGGSATSAPARAGSPDAAGAVAAARGLLSSLEQGDYQAGTRVTTGAAAAILAVREIIRQENERRGGQTDTTMQVGREPVLSAADGGSATVDVSVTVSVRVHGPEGEVSSSDTIEGPLLATHTADGWRVRDFVYSGGRLEPSWFTTDASDEEDGLVLQAGSILSYKTTTAVLVQIHNVRPEPAPVMVERATLVDAGGKEHPSRQLAFGSAQAPSGFLGFPRVDGRPQRLRVDMLRQTDGHRWTYDLAL